MYDTVNACMIVRIADVDNSKYIFGFWLFYPNDEWMQYYYSMHLAAFIQTVQVQNLYLQ